MTNTTKWVIGVVVVLVVILGFAAANTNNGGPNSDSSRTTDQNKPTGPVKLGVIAALTGDAAVYGETLRNVTQIAVDEINKSGGINGQQVEAIYEDGKCNGKDAASAMQKLVSVDKVQVVLGGFCSSESLAAVPIATQARVALFSPGSSSPDLTNVSRFFARNYPSDASQGVVLAEAAYGKKSFKSVAVMQEQTPYAQGLFKVFNEKFTSLGGNVVKEEFPSTVTDFRSQLTKLRAINPDALFLDTQTPAVSSRILKQVQDMNWKPQIIIADATIGDPATLTANAAILEGAIGAEFGVDPANPKFQHLLSAYKDKYGKEPNYQSYVQTIYDAIYIYKDAITAVGYDGEKVADYLHRLSGWSGASGSVTIGADGDRVGGHRLEIIQNGKPVVLQ